MSTDDGTCWGADFFRSAGSLLSKTARDFSASPTPIGRCRAGLREADLSYFSEIYRKSGFRGGLNWYRTSTATGNSPRPGKAAQIHQPSLFIAGSNDSVNYRLIGAKGWLTWNGCCRT